MPIYKTIIAKNKREAYDHLLKNLDHTNLEIIREGKVIKNKRRFFKVFKEEWYEIQVARYTKEVENIKNDKKKSNLIIKENLNSQVSKVRQNIKNKKNFENIIEQFQKKITLPSTNNYLKKPNFTFHTDKVLSPLVSERNIVKKKKQHLVEKFLIKKNFSLNFIKAIKEYLTIDDLNSTDNFKELASTIVSFIKIGNAISKFKLKNNKKVVFFVGSTGIGKTTTLCKVASSFFINENECYQKNIELKLASFDIRRLMAISQIEKFSEILNINFNRLDNKKSLSQLLNKSKQGSILLIDTSGISIKEQDLIEETEDYLDIPNSFEKEVIFCFSAGQKLEDLKCLFKKIETFNIDQTIITKVDESFSLGSAISFLYESKLPLTYITNGQDIPNDIIWAEYDLLAKLLLEEWLNEKSN